MLALSLLVLAQGNPPIAGIDITYHFAASADAKIIAAQVQAPDMKPWQVVCRNLRTGDFDIVSELDGKLSDRTCENIAVSQDGSAIAFTSPATTLGQSNPEKLSHIYGWDRTTKKLRCITANTSTEILKRHPYYLSLGKNGMTMFQTLPYTPTNTQSASWIIDKDGKTVRLMDWLGIKGMDTEVRSAMAGDGDRFVSVMQDSKSKHTALYIGSLSTKSYSVQTLRQNAKVGGLVISADGTTAAFNDWEATNGRAEICTYVVPFREAYRGVRIRHDKVAQYYDFALAISADGSTIMYQSAEGNISGEDAVFAGDWRANRWEQVSIDPKGKPNDHRCGNDMGYQQGFASSEDGSKVLMVAKFPKPLPGTIAKGQLFERDRINQTTTQIH